MKKVLDKPMLTVLLFFVFSCLSTYIGVSYSINSNLGIDNVNAETTGTCSNSTLTKNSLEKLNTNIAAKQDKLSANIGKYYGISNSTLINSTIPTYDNSAALYTNLRSITLEAGKYYISYYASFPTNATGWRSLGLKINDATGSPSSGSSGVLRVGANSSGYTNLASSWVVNLTETGTIYLVVQQSSGSNMTLNASGMVAIRIW